jgi:hypothetical protein
MAYRPSSCPTLYACSNYRAPLFSNPHVTVVTGDGNFPGGSSTAYNAQTILNTRQSVANHSWELLGWRAPPQIVAQAQDQTICHGWRAPNNAFTFIVATNANRYQWQYHENHLWRDIAGQTQSALYPWTGNYNRSYTVRCVASGPCYSTNSRAVRLQLGTCRNGWWPRPKSGSGYGECIAPIGDFTGDGYNDVAVGHAAANSPTPGTVYSMSGKDYTYAKT